MKIKISLIAESLEHFCATILLFFNHCKIWVKLDVKVPLLWNASKGDVISLIRAISKYCSFQSR